ncbi:MAG: hypothetical protein AABW64_02500, partial [Nanoarchaeota archaeon]
MKSLKKLFQKKECMFGTIAIVFIFVILLAAYFRTPQQSWEEPQQLPETSLPSYPQQTEQQEKKSFVYVPDSYNSRIQAFDLQGNFVFAFGKYGRDEGEFRMPTDVFDYGGKIYVLDKGNNRVQVYTSNGTFLSSFGEDRLKFPFGFDLSDEKIYITNTYKSAIDVYALDGTFLYSFGELGRKDGQFRYVSDVAVTDDYVYTLDTDNSRLQCFSHNGTFNLKWGVYTSKFYGLRFPLGIAAFDDKVYVADTRNNRMSIYSVNGTLLQQFGTYGKADDEFKFPSKLWFVDDILFSNLDKYPIVPEPVILSFKF